MAAVPKIDEFAFVLLAGLIFIIIMVYMWTVPTQGPPVVKDSHFDLSSASGVSKTFEFQVTSSGGINGVNLTASGDVGKWITFDKNNFNVAPGSPTTVKATIKVPAWTPEGVYNGRVSVTGAGGSDSFSIALTISEQSTQILKRPVYLGDFEVSYNKGSEVISSKESFTVSNSMFSSESVTLSSLIEEDKLPIVSGGSIYMLVSDSNMAGDLVVFFNEEQVYSGRVSEGQILLDLDNYTMSKSNTLTVSAGSPGVQFWLTPFYDIDVLEFSVDYDGSFSKTFSVNMSKDEVENFKAFDLFFRVREYSKPLPDMMIKINNQIVYWESPPLGLFDDVLSEDMFGNPIYLQEGNNEITFMFEQDAYYELSDTMLTIEYYS